MPARMDHAPGWRVTDMSRCCLFHFLLLALPVSVFAQPVEPQLGRLFFTPEQRQSLDEQRTEAFPYSRLDGVVKRSSGHNSVWIDRRLRTETDGALPITHSVGTSLPSTYRDR